MTNQLCPWILFFCPLHLQNGWTNRKEVLIGGLRSRDSGRINLFPRLGRKEKISRLVIVAFCRTHAFLTVLGYQIPALLLNLRILPHLAQTPEALLHSNPYYRNAS